MLSSSPIWKTSWKCRNLRAVVLPLCLIWMVACASQGSPWVWISKRLLLWTWTVCCGAERLLCLQIRYTDILYINIYLISVSINNLMYIDIRNILFPWKRIRKKTYRTMAVNILLTFQMHWSPLVKQRRHFGSCSVWFGLSHVTPGSSSIWFSATFFWSIHRERS